MTMELSQRATILTPSLTLSIDSKAKAMKAEGLDVCSFGAGEPDFDTPAHIATAGLEAIKNGFTRYTSVDGIDELKDAIIAKFQRDNGLTYERSQVLVSPGSSSAMHRL